jgi:hypothetical protein
MDYPSGAQFNSAQLKIVKDASNYVQEVNRKLGESKKIPLPFLAAQKLPPFENITPDPPSRLRQILSGLIFLSAYLIQGIRLRSISCQLNPEKPLFSLRDFREPQVKWNVKNLIRLAVDQSAKFWGRIGSIPIFLTDSRRIFMEALKRRDLEALGKIRRRTAAICNRLWGLETPKIYFGPGALASLSAIRKNPGLEGGHLVFPNHIAVIDSLNLFEIWGQPGLNELFGINPFRTIARQNWMHALPVVNGLNFNEELKEFFGVVSIPVSEGDAYRTLSELAEELGNEPQTVAIFLNGGRGHFPHSHNGLQRGGISALAPKAQRFTTVAIHGTNDYFGRCTPAMVIGRTVLIEEFKKEGVQFIQSRKDIDIPALNLFVWTEQLMLGKRWQNSNPFAALLGEIPGWEDIFVKHSSAV